MKDLWYNTHMEDPFHTDDQGPNGESLQHPSDLAACAQMPIMPEEVRRLMMRLFKVRKES